MKLIHWSSKENKKSILENGIKISDTWTSCSILTPFHNLNRWWVDFLLNKKEQIGFIFELSESDFPIVHSHWCIDTYQKQDDDLNVIEERRYNLSEILRDNPHSVFKNLSELKEDYKRTIIWRIGGTISELGKDSDELIYQNGIDLLKSDSKKINEFLDNPDFMEFVFEDYEVLLFNEIKPDRIIKVISENEEYQYSELINEIKTGANNGYK
ncbi:MULTISPECIES: hypothetical protein [Mesoflavibacter]|uniref:hypothetical protein n=1 Tax=Mesoflavibacter TaxID=444051 RepID=UPI0004254F45|nr:hypothetical protein [Mesoflavibacter zeaxanthinifaciens]